jgi:hypothetical protein
MIMTKMLILILETKKKISIKKKIGQILKLSGP